MIAAARLDPHLYEEVEADTSATGQAIMVVVLVGLATGIGALAGSGSFLTLVAAIALNIFTWGLLAYMTYVIGTRILPTPETDATFGQLARTTGFAQSPGVLRIFGFIPVFGTIIVIAVAFWQLAALVIAVRQALDYRSTGRALAVVFLGFIVLSVVNGLIFRL